MRNILFVVFLLLPSVCFGQKFNTTVDSSSYPSLINGAVVPGSVIPLHDSQAVLVWKIEPPYSVSSTRTVIDADIVPSVTFGNNVHNSGSGYYVNFDDYSLNYHVVDASTIFVRNGGINSVYINEIQEILASKNLGTVLQRQALINSFTGSPVQIINPSDIYAGFLNLFGPYANIFIGVFLTLFVVDLMTRKTKATVAESAKVARAAERREINQQIKNDTTAQVYKYRLSNLAGIKSGRIQDSEISQSQARRMFCETAEEYAEYRRSRGWVY